MLVENRGREALNGRPGLTAETILAWADAYRAAHGRWPVEEAGAVAEAPGESWGAISLALLNGSRGLPGGSSLARLLAERRDARNPKGLPHLAVKQLLASPFGDDHDGVPAVLHSALHVVQQATIPAELEPDLGDEHHVGIVAGQCGVAGDEP